MIKVAIYARVSTEHEAQISALANQIQYYDELLKKYPDYELYERYIDEGITGTSVNKRQNFIRMMEDAKAGKFELIITREVSRFARNTVDTLQQTRLLKSYNVGVWFTEDNIKTMNDEDGELRLTIMATLAQNESKKISARVKAGQMISFKNGVMYGNGNILGYNRMGSDMVINKEQADTVRRIYDLYLTGYGVRKIQFELESEHRLTAQGLSKWAVGNITKILHNPFYCGRIEYRKQYVPDYLTQKKIDNKGEVEKVIVKGRHQPIVTEEEFDKVQFIFSTRRVKKDGQTFGRSLAKSIWVKKLRCECGATFNRRTNQTLSDGTKKYFYQCYHQLGTGTVNTRKKRGLSTDGICQAPTFSEWKIAVQADFIFRSLVSNKQEIYDTAYQMLEGHLGSKSSTNDLISEIENNISAIDKLEHKLEAFADMCADGDISRELFNKKKDSINSKIELLTNANNDYRNEINNNKSQDDLEQRLNHLASILKVQAFKENAPVPESIIDKYVSKIVVYKDYFEWHFRSHILDEVDVLNNDTLKLNTKLKRFNQKNVPLQNTSDVHDSTGCITQITYFETLENPIFLGTYNVSKEYVKSILAYYCNLKWCHMPDFFTIKIVID